MSSRVVMGWERASRSPVVAGSFRAAYRPAPAPAEASGYARGPPSGPRDEPDNYWPALRKFVPVETVSLFLLLWGMYAGSNFDGAWLGWAIFWTVFGVTVVAALARALEDEAPLLSVGIQVLIVLAAYTLWTTSVGGPLVALPGYHPVLASMGAAGFTFVVPFMTQKLPQIWLRLRDRFR